MKIKIYLLISFTIISPLFAAEHGSLNSFLNACSYGNVDLIQKYIEKGINVNAQDQHGRYSVICAACNGHIEALNILLQANADLNLIDRNDSTALNYAVRFGHTKIVKRLLQAGAEVNTKDIWGDTPLYNAAFQGHIVIIDLLHQNKANPFLGDERTLFNLLENIEDEEQKEKYNDVLFYFMQHMDYIKYHTKFGISRKEYDEAYQKVFNDKNRETLLKYARKITNKYPTHPLQRLYRSAKPL